MAEPLIDLQSALEEIDKVSELSALQNIKAKYLGKQGVVTRLFKQLSTIPQEEKKAFGQMVNNLKKQLESKIAEKRSEIERRMREEKEQKNRFDITLPGAIRDMGAYHIVTQVMEEVQEFWLSMGFEIATGPEVEEVYYNFEALNTPEWHPARDMHDTFYFNSNRLLRTHTSPIQIRVMEKRNPPLAIFAPGKCYRKDTPDTTHLPMFHQFEVLYVDRHVSVGHLKGVLETFVKRIFGKDRKIRLRPSFFPFTEPSFEVDVSCGICGGAGCRSCGGTGWLEILGSGIVHPNVFRSVGYDPEEWSGFALGMGVERVVMLKHDIADIRDLLRNDKRFLRKFMGVNI